MSTSLAYVSGKKANLTLYPEHIAVDLNKLIPESFNIPLDSILSIRREPAVLSTWQKTNGYIHFVTSTNEHVGGNVHRQSMNRNAIQFEPGEQNPFYAFAAAVERALAGEAPKPSTCPTCRGPISQSDGFCANCGTKIERGSGRAVEPTIVAPPRAVSPSGTSAPRDTDQHKSSGGSKAVLIIVSIILILGVWGWAREQGAGHSTPSSCNGLDSYSRSLQSSMPAGFEDVIHNVLLGSPMSSVSEAAMQTYSVSLLSIHAPVAAQKFHRGYTDLVAGLAYGNGPWIAAGSRELIDGNKSGRSTCGDDWDVVVRGE